MGWLARRSERIATAAVEKAMAMLPAGAVGGRDVSAEVATIAQQQFIGAPVPAQRLPWNDPTVPFGPGIPPPPGTLDPLFARSQRPLPRRYEYPISWNIPGQGRPYAPWSLLRQMGRQSLVRRCIELRKNRLTSLDWRIAVRPEIVQAVAEEAGTRKAQAKSDLTKRMQPEIDRLTEFWQKPDRIARWTFAEWLGALLEEHFVLDAVTIYPHPQLNGDLHSFELLAGDTIKPLLDYRGATPQPPAPAFEQVLYGFPRGEFMHSDQGEDFTSDELIYRPKVRRIETPYGFSPTEMALLDADLYMKRIEWLRAEYNVGVQSEMYLLPPEQDPGTGSAWTPERLKQYESIMNEELSGQTAERHRARLLIPGMKPEFPPEFAEKYRSEFDEHMLRLTIMHFGVMPTELGITPKTGLGGSGHQQGEAKSAERNADQPYLEWLTDILNDISRTYLDMPPELGFAFDLDDEEDDVQQATAQTTLLKTGLGTLNSMLADRGEPTFDFPEADEPFVLTQNGPVFFRGLLEAAEEEAAAPPPAPGGPAPIAPNLGPEGQAEVKSFWNYAANRARKGSWTDFDFAHVPPETADALNLMAAASVGKAKGRRPPQAWSANHEKLAAHYTPEIARALGAAIDTDKLARDWLKLHGG